MTKINLAAAAERACLSRHHFSRAFKKTTNVTYQEYVTVRRVEKAKELLKNPRRSIMEIAHFVGYSDPNNLIRNFNASSTFDFKHHGSGITFQHNGFCGGCK